MDRISSTLRETYEAARAAVRAITGSVRENKGMAAASVVLAFGLWIFVSHAENPSTSGVLENVPVQAVNTPPDVVLSDTLPTVRLRVRVSKDVFDSLSPADFAVTVDLQGMTVGEYDAPVHVEALTTRGSLSVEEVLPRTIRLTLVQLVSKSVPAEVEIEGQAPRGYTLGAPKIKDTAAVVSGSEPNVSQVVKVVAPLNVDGRTDSVHQSVRFVPRDQRGNLVQQVQVEPSLTDVSVDIKQEDFSRTVAVAPVTSGSPANGYNIVAINVTPPTVTVHGSKEFIAAASSIPTHAVDVSGATSDVVTSVSLDLPSGASIAGGVPVVTVTVKVQAGVGQMTIGVPVSATNLDSSLAVRGGLGLVQVTLFGPLPRLNALTPNDVVAMIDLGGQGAGTASVQVKVTAPSGIEIRAVNPTEIAITLESR